MFTYHTALYYALYDTSRVDIRTRSPIYEDEPRKGVRFRDGAAAGEDERELFNLRSFEQATHRGSLGHFFSILLYYYQVLLLLLLYARL